MIRLTNQSLSAQFDLNVFYSIAKMTCASNVSEIKIYNTMCRIFVDTNYYVYPYYIESYEDA